DRGVPEHARRSGGRRLPPWTERLSWPGTGRAETDRSGPGGADVRCPHGSPLGSNPGTAGTNGEAPWRDQVATPTGERSPGHPGGDSVSGGGQPGVAGGPVPGREGNSPRVVIRTTARGGPETRSPKGMADRAGRLPADHDRADPPAPAPP